MGLPRGWRVLEFGWYLRSDTFLEPFRAEKVEKPVRALEIPHGRADESVDISRGDAISVPGTWEGPFLSARRDGVFIWQQRWP